MSLPANVTAELDLAGRLLAGRDLPGALAALQRAERLAPDAEPVLKALAAFAATAGDHTAAEHYSRRLVARFPEGPHLPGLALAIFNQGRYPEALPMLEQLQRRGRTPVPCLIAYGTALEKTGQVLAGVRILEAVFDAAPTESVTELILGALTRNSEREYLARFLDKAVGRYPDNAVVQWMRAEHELRSHNFGAGFDLAGHRHVLAAKFGKAMHGAAGTTGLARWDGKPFDGVLLVDTEQGLGDVLLYSSMFESLVALGQRALVACDARLHPLFARSFPTLRFCVRDDDAFRAASRQRTARCIDAFDLGQLYRRGLRDFPPRRAWLVADPARRDALRAQLASRFPGKRLVGISWRSNRRIIGETKSIPLADFEPLLQRPDVVAINLQYGNTRAETEALAARGLAVHEVPGIDLDRDIDGLAALIAALDQVISGSNTTVHLAGALGVPTTALLHGNRFIFWYWGYEGESTPWYPSVRLFRGPPAVPWRALVARAADDIQ